MSTEISQLQQQMQLNMYQMQIQLQMCQMQLAMQQQNNRRNNKICIFDWDDTIMPTTSIIKNKELVSAEELNKLGESVLDLLTKYTNTFGVNNVYIVTNGSENWVFESLGYLIRKMKIHATNDYWHQLYHFLQNNKVTIISAKHLYAQQYPNQPTIWKTLVFKQLLINNGAVNNKEFSIVSIGDSKDEFTASMEAKKMLTEKYCMNVTLHRIKLQTAPVFANIARQMNSIISVCDELYESSSDKTLRF